MDRYRFDSRERAVMERSRVPCAIYQFIDRRVVTLMLSDGFCRLFGYEDPAEAYFDMDNNMYRGVHPDDTARISEAAFRFATGGGRYEVIYRSRKKNGGAYRVIHAMGEHFVTDTGVRLAEIWYTDEGEYSEADERATELSRSLSRALHQESLLSASYYDYLTGLPSMTYFFELAEAGRAAMRKRGVSPALLFMDLSGMKYFNRKHGFSEGDKLLRAMAGVLTRYFSSENCSRFGQDHFVAYTEEAGLEDVLRRLFEDCRAVNGGRTLPLRVGICLDRMEQVDISTACDRAKYACDALRNTYESGYNCFSAAMKNDVERRQYIIDNLDRAISEGWISVYYQPIVRAVNGRVCDEEALARWIDPVKDFLSPGEFIPILEDARLIYKLDLYVLDQVLEKLRTQAAAGLYLVPQSINLSRADFDACDIVEEIRRRVDASGLGRDKVTIEVTESTVGGDFDFMKAQVARFRELGFAVWMDDFGSGYSSLDLLQSIRFDLIKFDMSFMQQFDEGDSSRIILTELMKMATALNIDTVCEGVETAAQVRFLQEIGCSKLQGYYFARPMPLERILERYRTGVQIGFENPREADYFDAIGRINLYDLGVVAREGKDLFENVFDTVPMAILEVMDGKMRYIRSNRSYREFAGRVLGLHVPEGISEYTPPAEDRASVFMDAFMRCCWDGSRAFIDDKLADDSTIHAFIRRIAINPVTGSAAMAVTVLSVMKADQGATYANIARALAADYKNLFYVDLSTERFIEYSSDVGRQEMAVERHGDDFFAAARRDAKVLLHPEDREAFIEAFTRENVLRALDEQGAYTCNFRLARDGDAAWMSMKVTRMGRNSQYIIVGVSNIEAQMRQSEEMERARRDQIACARIMALSGGYICLYTVDPDTGRFSEYSGTDTYEALGLPKAGEDFFRQAREEWIQFILPEDRPIIMRMAVREHMLEEIARDGLLVVRCRLLIRGKPMPVVARAALVRESDGDKLIIGLRVCDGRLCHARRSAEGQA